MHPEVRNPKPEIRNKSEIQNPNGQNEPATRVLVIRILDFGFVSNFGFRISDFVSHVGILTHQGLSPGLKQPGLRSRFDGKHRAFKQRQMAVFRGPIPGLSALALGRC